MLSPAVFEYITLGVLALYTVWAVKTKQDSNAPIIIAALLLLCCGVLLGMGMVEIADRVAIVVYYLLWVGLVMKIVEIWREERESQKASPSPSPSQEKTTGENEEEKK